MIRHIQCRVCGERYEQDTSYPDCCCPECGEVESENGSDDDNDNGDDSEED